MFWLMLPSTCTHYGYAVRMTSILFPTFPSFLSVALWVIFRGEHYDCCTKSTLWTITWHRYLQSGPKMVFIQGWIFFILQPFMFFFVLCQHYLQTALCYSSPCICCLASCVLSWVDFAPHFRNAGIHTHRRILEHNGWLSQCAPLRKGGGGGGRKGG